MYRYTVYKLIATQENMPLIKCTTATFRLLSNCVHRNTSKPISKGYSTWSRMFWSSEPYPSSAAHANDRALELKVVWCTGMIVFTEVHLRCHQKEESAFSKLPAEKATLRMYVAGAFLLVFLYVVNILLALDSTCWQ